MSLIKRLSASIQTRLLGVFLINTLLTVAIVITFNQWLRTSLMSAADDALLASAAQMANRIDEFNRSNKQAFNVGSRLPPLVDYLEASEEERLDPDFRDHTRTILDSLEIEPWDEYYVLSQAILDRDGRNILDTVDKNIGTDESDQEYFRATMSGGAINVSPVQFNPALGGIYFYYAIPIRQDDAATSVLGVLRVQLSISSVQNIVFNSTRGQEWDIAVFDENFVRVADSQREDLLFRSITTYSPEQIAVLRSTSALPPLPDADISIPVPGLVEILSDTHQERVISGLVVPDNDAKQHMAVIQLETLPWHLVLYQPADQHFRPIQQQTTGILVLTIALTLVALVSSYFIARRITRPIRVLTATAHQVAEGDLRVRAPITSRDEVGVLTHTFNRMTAELEIAQHTLEERVAQRTRELSESNAKLKHEIVERHRYEKQALELALEQQRHHVLSEFIRKASHEFRTPLSIIGVNSFLVKKHLPAEKQHYITVLEEQGHYIAGLVDHMVLMTRLDSGMPIATTVRVRIDDVIRTVHAIWSDTPQEKNATVHLDLNAAGVSVVADAELLIIAVQNILGNAVRYSVDPAVASIKTGTQQGQVVISVADNGVGIPAELHERVFERFFRVDEAHTTRGFGLGLPIAKLVIENLGGTIELASAVGQGTTVTITLAIAAEE